MAIGRPADGAPPEDNTPPENSTVPDDSDDSTAPDDGPVPAVAYEKPMRTVVVLAGASITAALTQTVVVPLIPRFPAMFSTDAANASWIITVTLLSGAVTTPVSGRLGDIFGKKRMILVLLVPLLLGSLLCGFATNLPLMVLGRGLQGLAMGMIPLAVALVRDVVPPHRLGSGLSIMSSSFGVGGAIGLPLSAAVAQWANWRVLFFGTAVVAVLMALLIRRLVPRGTRTPLQGRFDFGGMVLFAAGLVCLLLAISKGGTWGWADPLTLGCFVGSALFLLVWGAVELRVREPLVDLRVTARTAVLLTNAASILVGFSWYAQNLAIPQFLQADPATGHGLGLDMVMMGLALAPAGAVMMAVSPIGGRFIDWIGPRTTLVVGISVVVLAYVSFYFLSGSVWGIVVMTSLVSVGMGLAYGSMPTLILGSVPQSMSAAANSFNSLMRSLGSTISAAVVGAVLALMTQPFAGTEVASLAGFRTAVALGGGAALLAALTACFIPVPGRRRRRRTVG